MDSGMPFAYEFSHGFSITRILLCGDGCLLHTLRVWEKRAKSRINAGASMYGTE
jgi:hypothetical protein